MCPPIQKPRLKVTHNKGDGPTVADREHEKAKAIEYSFPLDDERSDIIVFNQRFAKNLWKTTVVDSGNIVP